MLKNVSEFLKDPINRSLIILSFIANLIQVFCSLPIWTSIAIVFISFIIPIFVYYIRELKKTKRLLIAVNKNMADHYRFLNEFLLSIKSLPAPDPIIFDEFHHIKSFQNTSWVFNNDYGIRRKIKGRNLSQKPTDGIMLKIGGGSSVEYNNLEVKYLKVNSKQNITPILIKEEERVKWIKIPFPRALEPNGEFLIEFEIWWPHAIRSGTDGIILGETIDYKLGINEINCTFMFDKQISIINAFSLDIENGSFELDQSQPTQIASLNTKYPSCFTWEKYQPLKTKLYLIIFSRE